MGGYMDQSYAASFAELGTPRELPHCQGWILERQIPGFPYRDAMGLYPLFCCNDWSQLHADLDELGDDLVSLTLVTDPFGEYDSTYLQHCFKDLTLPFKEHFIIDLDRPLNKVVSRHHRQRSNKALRDVTVEVCDEPLGFIDEWITLYSGLVEKHGITGMHAFSRTAFTKQLTVPGLVMFRAVHEGAVLGISTVLVEGDVGYGHLQAFNERGYELGASYALNWTILEYFVGKVRWLDFGAAAGLADDKADGLTLYKRGWSKETRTAYLCGRILNPELYAKISQEKGTTTTSYFPAYRKGEFGG
jgi:hypothetical protein